MSNRTDSEPIYAERYVAFIDIPGFSEIVRNSISSAEQATELVRILERISSRAEPLEFDKSHGDDFRAQSFSDCIVVSERATQAGLEHLLFVVAQLQLDLLANRILTRGGIAKGKLCHTDKIVLGPALITAYQLENTIAAYPRVIVDRATHEDYNKLDVAALENKFTGIAPRLRYDEDGPVFADFLAPFRNLGTSPHRERLRVTAQSCHAAIQSQVNDSIYDPRIYKKLRWMALYWNGMSMSQGADCGLEHVKFPAMANLYQ
jgi:hypothetical protein